MLAAMANIASECVNSPGWESVVPPVLRGRSDCRAGKPGELRLESEELKPVPQRPASEASEPEDLSQAVC